MSESNLSSIPNLPVTSQELLEAVGYRRMEELAQSHELELHAEIEQANRILKIAEETPGREEVSEWLRHAREVTGLTEAPAMEEVPVRLGAEELPRLSIRLQTAPMAIPLPGSFLQEHGLMVPDIPLGVLAREHYAAGELQGENRIPGVRAEVLSKRLIQWQHGESRSPDRSESDLPRFKTIHEIEELKARLPKRNESPMDGRVALIRAPRPETNHGVNPGSRRYVRGVLHSHPLSIGSGAILTLVMMVLAPAAVISSILLLLSREKPRTFDWVPEWWLAFPLALPVVAFAWMIWGLSGSCRVCGQRLFIHRHHRKNAKAHHVPGLGYVFPLCIHILLFRWFRCTHCGTPVRLKK